MADEIIRLDYSAEDIGDNIDEVREARGEYDSLDERLDEIEGGGFTPTQAQLDAMNSTATQAKIEQIETNKNNISSLRAYGGLKNYAMINNGTYTANSGGGAHSITIPLLSPITGDIVISIGNITSNDVDSSTCAFVFKNDITSRDTVAVSRGDNINVPVSMGTFVATKVEIYPAATYQTSSGDTVSWTDLMICTKEDWDNSHDYQPYALSNAELTYNISLLTPQIVSTDITELAAESYADGTVCGYANSFAGLSAAWVVVRTYTLNREGSRKMQIVEAHTGNRKTRFFNGAWGAWS